MRCPYCSSRETKVVDKRDGDGVTRRRRRCASCAGRFTTYERPEIARLFVVKKDGRREEFSRAKLGAGLAKACTKRPVSAEAIERLVLHPFAHLFGDLAAPAVAVAVLDGASDRLRAAGLTVHRSPFGWFTRWDLQAKGHPLSRIARVVRVPPGAVQ